jgi:hypothetical protein
MKTAGVVFDFYDDPTGSLLKKTYPTANELPEKIKEAHILSTEERDVLRDGAFALRMNNDGQVLRKFACVDAGNTLLSMLYLEQAAEILPEEAVKVAASNLFDFADEFGLQPTEFVKKAASGMARKRDPMSQPMVGDEADWAQRTNLVSIRGGSDSGRVIPTANQMKTASIKDGLLEISGQDAKPKVKKASAEKLALGRFPLDSYGDVKAAVRYFDEHWTELYPAQRHEFAVKTAARAHELDIQTSEILDRYGSTGYAPDIDAHIASRKASAPQEFKDSYNLLKEKRSSVSPDEFVDLLTQVDKAAGLNWHWGASICDPYMATFGGLEKSAQVEAWSWQNADGVHVDAAQLKALAGTDLIGKNFSADVAEAFKDDPVAIFESMPDNSKTIMAKLANEG